jgi:hypothetical protein
MKLKEATETILREMAPSVTNEQKLVFLETMSWLLANDGEEPFGMRRRWIAEQDEEFLDLALLPWSLRVSESVSEGESILSPLLKHDRYKRKAQERLDELTRNTN